MRSSTAWSPAACAAWSTSSATTTPACGRRAGPCCQFHLALNALHHAPTLAIRRRIGAELRRIWNAATLADAEAELRRLVASYAEAAPDLAAWLEANVPEFLAVFTLPQHHRKRLSTANPI